MRRLFTTLACGFLLTACAPKPHGTWRASHPNAERPAIGIELVRNGKILTGSMFILSPDRPQDFTSGQRFPMTIKSDDDQEIHYTVEFRPHEPDNLVLHLSKPVAGESFHAVLVTTNGHSTPMDFDFERVINP